MLVHPHSVSISFSTVPALTCDIKSIPKVNLTIYRIVPHPKRGDRTLPGRVKVTYICAPTLVLENPGKDSLECHYNVDPDNEAHVTANWTTEEGINCIFGKLQSQ